jgi:hypothetical protein
LNRPLDYQFYPNYANTFNSEKNICYDLPEQQHVVIKIYNPNGQEVAQLVDKIQNPGFYRITWNVSNHPNGVYI